MFYLEEIDNKQTYIEYVGHVMAKGARAEGKGWLQADSQAAIFTS